MREFNMTQIAKELGEKTDGKWEDYTDTYRQIEKEKIVEMDGKGYDLVQVADENNCHIKFKWEKRV